MRQYEFCIPVVLHYVTHASSIIEIPFLWGSGPCHVVSGPYSAERMLSGATQPSLITLPTHTKAHDGVRDVVIKVQSMHGRGMVSHYLDGLV